MQASLSAPQNTNSTSTDLYLGQPMPFRMQIDPSIMANVYALLAQQQQQMFQLQEQPLSLLAQSPTSSNPPWAHIMQQVTQSQQPTTNENLNTAQEGAPEQVVTPHSVSAILNSPESRAQSEVTLNSPKMQSAAMAHFDATQQKQTAKRRKRRRISPDSSSESSHNDQSADSDRESKPETDGLPEGKIFQRSNMAPMKLYVQLDTKARARISKVFQASQLSFERQIVKFH